MTTTGRAAERRSLARRLLREVLLVGGLFVVYNLGRVLAAQRVSGAYDNADRVWELERLLGLPSEQTLQQVVLAVPELTRVANGYYAAVHFPLTFGVLVWLFVRRPGGYLWARRALVAATAAGLVVQTLLPVAPPRMLGGLGFVDTGLAFGQSVYGAVGEDALSNQFAAMPSLHVGWAVLLAVVVIRTGRSRWRWLWVLHPLVTVLVVVVTANHFWLDALAGALVVVLALLEAGRSRHRRPRAEPAVCHRRRALPRPRCPSGQVPVAYPHAALPAQRPASDGVAAGGRTGPGGRSAG